MTLIDILIALIIACGFTGITIYLATKHRRRVDKVKVGDKVRYGAYEAEILEVGENTFEIKITVNKMGIDFKK
jgi:preprotein translocase subunit YajC